jgi:hypothetical protein
MSNATPTYNRRDFALTFARDRRCGTLRRILDLAAQERPQGMRPDTIFWAPAPLRSVINAIQILMQQRHAARRLTTDTLMYIFAFIDPMADLDAMGWRLPLPENLSHPPTLPGSVAAQLNQLQHQHQQALLKQQPPASDTQSAAAALALLPPLPSATYSTALRLYRCSLYPPRTGPRNILIARVLTPHRHLSNEELNMYLGRYGFVNSEPLSADGFVVSESETAAANPHRAGQIRVLYFLVQVDSPLLATRAIESCLVAQIDI